MLASYIDGTAPPESRHFGNEPPSIFTIQDRIEAAWDMGIRPEGRIETGGIKGTRKFIGTPEARTPTP
jgi:hypothetical protein